MARTERKTAYRKMTEREGLRKNVRKGSRAAATANLRAMTVRTRNTEVA